MRLSYVLAFSSLIAVTAAAPSGEPRASSSGTQSVEDKVIRFEDYYDRDDPSLETDECQVAKAALHNDPHLSQCKYREQFVLYTSMVSDPNLDGNLKPNLDGILEALCPMKRCDQKVIDRHHKNIADSCMSNPVHRTNFIATGMFYTPHVEAGCFKDYDGQWIVSKVAATGRLPGPVPLDNFCARGAQHVLGTALDYATKNGVPMDSFYGELLHDMKMFYREKCSEEQFKGLTKAIGPPYPEDAWKVQKALREIANFWRFAMPKN